MHIASCRRKSPQYAPDAAGKYPEPDEGPALRGWPQAVSTTVGLIGNCRGAAIPSFTSKLLMKQSQDPETHEIRQTLGERDQAQRGCTYIAYRKTCCATTPRRHRIGQVYTLSIIHQDILGYVNNSVAENPRPFPRSETFQLPDMPPAATPLQDGGKRF